MKSLEIIAQSFGYCPKYQPEITSTPESLSLRSDNGRWLILKAVTKTLCCNLFITSTNSLFEHVCRIKCKLNRGLTENLCYVMPIVYILCHLMNSFSSRQ